MTWRDRPGHATFRGVPFFVDAGERSGGRETAVHEFPFSEKPPVTDDMGRKSRVFSVTGYVIGEEYTRARDALLVALEDTEGPGELVHPYYGTRRVVVGPAPFRVTESTREGGMATFSIEFTETSDLVQPSVAPDHRAVVVTRAAALKTSLREQFLTAFSRVTLLRASATNALQSVRSTVAAVLDVRALATQEMASLRRQLDDFAADAESLVTNPEELIDTLTGLVESFGGGLLTVANSLDPTGGLLKLYAFNPGVRPPADTPSRAVEQANFDALQYAVQRLVIAQASLLAIEQTFPTYEGAVRVRSEIVSRIDEHVESASDDVFPELVDLRAALVRAVPGEESDLPRLQKYTSPGTVPSLVLAHRLYGNLDREQDLIDRNRVSNPSQVPGGVELEVLSS